MTQNDGCLPQPFKRYDFPRQARLWAVPDANRGYESRILKACRRRLGRQRRAEVFESPVFGKLAFAGREPAAGESGSQKREDEVVKNRFGDDNFRASVEVATLWAPSRGTLLCEKCIAARESVEQ